MKLQSWQLWVRPDGTVQWYDPKRSWSVKPGPPFVLKGTFEVNPHRGLVGRPPTGMLKAEPARQVYGLGGPYYVYADLHRTCKGCRNRFVFGAAEQQFWYEKLRLWNEITAHRCVACRKKRRTEKAAQKALMAAHEALQADDTPQNQLALAEATVGMIGFVGPQALRRGIAAARKATKGGLDAEGAEEALQAAVEGFDTPGWLP